MVEGGGFEPPKASPTDLQSVPFDHSGTPPHNKTILYSLEFYRSEYVNIRLDDRKIAGTIKKVNVWQNITISVLYSTCKWRSLLELAMGLEPATC